MHGSATSPLHIYVDFSLVFYNILEFAKNGPLIGGCLFDFSNSDVTVFVLSYCLY